MMSDAIVAMVLVALSALVFWLCQRQQPELNQATTGERLFVFVPAVVAFLMLNFGAIAASRMAAGPSLRLGCWRPDCWYPRVTSWWLALLIFG